MKSELSIYEFMEMFPDEEAAVAFFEQRRWRGKPYCPYCGSFSVARCAKPMPWRCRDCRKHFSVRTGTVMAESKLPLHKWLFAIHLIYTSRKGVASLQLARLLNVTQKTAWFLAHRIRATMGQSEGVLSGAVEVDETYVGGSDRNRHANKKYRQGPGSGKVPVFGVRERNGDVRAFPIPDASRKTLHGAINEHVAQESTVFSDDWKAYRKLEGYWHAWVRHSKGEYVVDEAHTNSIESVWAVLKRGHKGVYHSMSEKHLQRYLWEFCERLNTIALTPLERLGRGAERLAGIALPYRDLVRPQPLQAG